MNREITYEKFFGIKTEQEENEVESQEFYYSYQATSYSSLITIFDKINISSDDTLVDIGAGLGRVVCYCNQRFNCNVKGIEYDKVQYKELQNNIEYYKVRFHGNEDKMHIYNIDALLYQIKPQDNFFYFFNPFNYQILDKMMKKILESAKANPRLITIIFYYITPEYIDYMRTIPVKLERIIKLPSYLVDLDEKAYVYSILE